MFKIGFIDYYLNEWHANNYPKLFREESNGEFICAYAYGEITDPKKGVTSEEWAKEHGVELCSSVEEVIEKSDGLIILSPDNCERHEKLAEKALMSGKPTYIDKTFAPDLSSGKRMFELAAKYNTPVYSTSAIRYAAEYETVKNTDIKSISLFGPGNLDSYAIHMLDPLISLVRCDAKRVMCVGNDSFYTINIELENGKLATVTGFAGKNPFYVNIANDEKEHLFPIAQDAWQYWRAFTRAAIKFFTTKVPVVAHNDSLAATAIRTAALESLNNGNKWVNVEEKFF